MRTIQTAGLLLLLAPLLHAQDGRQAHHPWNNLSTLRPGQKIQVQTSAEKRSGAFLSFTADSVSIQAKNGVMAIPRTEIKRVRRNSATARMRHALIGAGIGAAAGTAIAVPNINEGYAAYTAVAAAVLTVVGSTVVGAILPAHSTVYEAP